MFLTGEGFEVKFERQKLSQPPSGIGKGGKLYEIEKIESTKTVEKIKIKAFMFNSISIV